MGKKDIEGKGKGSTYNISGVFQLELSAFVVERGDFRGSGVDGFEDFGALFFDFLYNRIVSKTVRGLSFLDCYVLCKVRISHRLH